VFSVQEEEGWLRGRLRGKTGVFPSNFVRLSAAETDKPKCKISADSFWVTFVSDTLLICTVLSFFIYSGATARMFVSGMCLLLCRWERYRVL